MTLPTPEQREIAERTELKRGSFVVRRQNQQRHFQLVLPLAIIYSARLLD
jgi:hypothetical protein